MRSKSLRSIGLTLALLATWDSSVEVGHGGEGLSAAPDFELVTVGGEVVSNVSLRGQPALLVFWAPWCNVCRKELPEIANFYRQGKPAQLRVISIGFADLRANVDAFVKDRPEVFLFPTAYDEDRWVAQAFRVRVTPTYVVLNQQGEIAVMHLGAGLLQNDRFRAFLSGLKQS